MPTETNDGKIVQPDKVTVSAGRVAPTVDDGIETFQKARKIAPHAGVVKSVLRLFDERLKEKNNFVGATQWVAPTCIMENKCYQSKKMHNPIPLAYSMM